MLMSQFEMEDFENIERFVEEDLINDEQYRKLLKRKEEIENFLKAMGESQEVNCLIDTYSKVGQKIKKLEMKWAYKITMQEKNKEREKRSFWKIIKNRQFENEDYTIKFNKIVNDSEYKEKLDNHINIFKLLEKKLENDRKLLYELESVESKIAIMETDLLRKYIEEA